MKKAIRLASFNSVHSFLADVNGIKQFDVIVRQFDNNTKTVEIFEGISISFSIEDYPYSLDEKNYSIAIHWGDDCSDHNISFNDLPQQFKSCFDSMHHFKNCQEMYFQNNWHKNLLIYIIPHDENTALAEKKKQLLEQ